MPTSKKLLRLKAGMTTGSRKQATGLLTARDDEVLERSLEKTVKNSHALLLGKGRRFNSGRPHHN